MVSDDDDLMLVSRKGMSARFKANDETLRPMGRSTSGVIGMRFRGDDSLLSMEVVSEGADLVTVTDGGFAKRTSVDQWATKGRGILGVRAMRLVEERGALVGALVCYPGDEIFAVANDGVVIRTRVDEVVDEDVEVDSEGSEQRDTERNVEVNDAASAGEGHDDPQETDAVEGSTQSSGEDENS